MWLDKCSEKIVYCPVKKIVLLPKHNKVHSFAEKLRWSDDKLITHTILKNLKTEERSLFLFFSMLSLYQIKLPHTILKMIGSRT